MVTQRVITRQGQPSVQSSRMMKLKIKFEKNKCLSAIRSTQVIPIHKLIQQEHIIKHVFYITLQFDPLSAYGKFYLTHV